MSFLMSILAVLAFLCAPLTAGLSIDHPKFDLQPQRNLGVSPHSLANVTIFIPLIMRMDSGFYVSPAGNDLNPGTIHAPWRTVQHAVTAAPQNATVFLRAGSYSGFIVERTNLTISGYPGETPSILSDGTTRYTVKILNSSGIKLTGLSFHDNPVTKGAGIYVETSTDILVDHNRFYDNIGFGVVTKDVTRVTIKANDLYRNANAIEIRYGSDTVIIRDNDIHDNFRDLDSGRGAMGVNFYRTTGPVTAINNRLWNNHALAPDTGGSAFELYEGGNVSMIGNILWDNRTVFETGTESGVPCDNIRFTHNIVYRGSYQQGLILRCASNTLVANNVFDSLDKFVFYINQFKGPYGGSVENLRIVNNIAINGRVYSIDTELPASVHIDHNLLYNPDPGSASLEGDSLAYVASFGQTLSLADFQTWTGYDLHSRSAPPAFVDARNHNYNLLSGSPAIDLGENIGEPYVGKAPDAGAHEYSSSP